MQSVTSGVACAPGDAATAAAAEPQLEPKLQHRKQMIISRLVLLRCPQHLLVLPVRSKGTS